MTTIHISPPVPSTRTGFTRRCAVLLATTVAAFCALAAMSAATPSAQAATKTWFVAPSGSGSACGGNSKSSPFGTIQAALACAGDGDVVSLAPSGSTPYPGVGAVSHSVSIVAGSGDARSVKVDLSQPADSSGFTAGLMSVPSGASVKLRGLTLECTGGQGCLAQTCLTTVCVGSLVTNNGALSVDHVMITGAQHGAAINNVSTGATPARLTVTSSTIAQNTNDGVAGDGTSAAAISSTFAGAGVGQPTVAATNSTIADNNDQAGSASAGGIYTNTSQTGAVTLVNDTITGNFGEETGGVADVISGGAATPVVLTNTLIAGNTSGGSAPDCRNRLADGPGGSNLIGDSTNCTGLTNGTANDQLGSSATPINPLLAPLGLNGGPTETSPPLSGSPVIGGAIGGNCEVGPVFNRDQRGQLRNAVARDVCDIGAYDTGGSAISQTAPTITSAASSTGIESKPMSFTVTTTGTPKAALTESGALPTGVSFTANPDGTATIAGTAAAGSAGQYPITITATNGVMPDATQAFTLTIVAPPTVTSIAPSTFGQGATSVVAQVNGSGFAGPTKVTLSGPGKGVKVTVVSTTATALSVRVTVAVGTTTGAYNLEVTNGNGGSASCSGCLTVVAGPIITGISPSTAARGQRTTFTVTGTGFSSDAKLTGPNRVTFSGVTVSPDGTTITAQMTVGASAAPGSNLPVVVTDGPLGNYGSVKDNALTIT